MPIYEYECSSCGRRFEMLRRISEMDATVHCLGCHSTQAARIVTQRFYAPRDLARPESACVATPTQQPDGYLEDVRFINCHTAISATNSSIMGRNLTISGCDKS